MSSVSRDTNINQLFIISEFGFTARRYRLIVSKRDTNVECF